MIIDRGHTVLCPHHYSREYFRSIAFGDTDTAQVSMRSNNH